MNNSPTCPTCQGPKTRTKSYCTPCKRVYDRAYREKNREKLHEYERERKLRATYGIGSDDFDRMVIEQGGKCGLCKETPEPNNRLGPTLVVDHDHSTGKVRALLCHSCNIVLGHFKDDPERLKAALIYLETHGEA